MGRDPLADDDEVLARTIFGRGDSARREAAGLSGMPSPSTLPPTVRRASPGVTGPPAANEPGAAGTPGRTTADRVAAPPADTAVAPATPGAPGTRKAPSASARRARNRRRQPDHYKIISISLYTEDIERMDELVRQLKRRGFTRANRSALIRFALDQVDIDKMPRGY